MLRILVPKYAGSNPRTWVPKASILLLDHRSRLRWSYTDDKLQSFHRSRNFQLLTNRKALSWASSVQCLTTHPVSPNFTSCFCKIRFHILAFMPRFHHTAPSYVDRQVMGYSTTKIQGRIRISVVWCTRIITDDELERIWGKVDVAHFRIQSWRSLLGTEENYKKAEPVNRRFEPRISRIKSEVLWIAFKLLFFPLKRRVKISSNRNTFSLSPYMRIAHTK
jgi:hypothetical protein